jgi:hypothetical protein
MGTGGPSPGVKPGCDANHSPPINCRGKECVGATFISPRRLNGDSGTALIYIKIVTGSSDMLQHKWKSSTQVFWNFSSDERSHGKGGKSDSECAKTVIEVYFHIRMSDKVELSCIYNSSVPFLFGLV